MPRGRVYIFRDFELDTRARRLSRRGIECRLRAKSFAVLVHLVANAGRLVSHEELMSAVWPGTRVGRAVLRVSIREIRAVLGDAADLVTTVSRLGHRFDLEPSAAPSALPFVGRAPELGVLRLALQRALAAERSVVLLSGDAGMGKSRVVEEFLVEVRESGSARVAVGRCVDLLGGREPYAGLVDLLDDLRGKGDDLAHAFERLAPHWGRRLGDRQEWDPSVDDAGAAWALLRELERLVQAVSADVPLVVVLEDLQWADTSTIEAVASLAQRDNPAKLLIVCTVRTSGRLHAAELERLERGLAERGHSVVAPLRPFDWEEVESYLRLRVAAPVAAGTAERLLGRTGGRPIFLRGLVDHLLVQGQLTPRDGVWTVDEAALVAAVPLTLREVITADLAALSPDQRRILDAASVVGARFPAATVAPAVGMDVAGVEDACDQLVAEGRLVHAGVERWPDGTVCARYAFRFGLEADVLYSRLRDATRGRLHALIDEHVAPRRVEPIDAVADLLGRHFALAGDTERAWYSGRQAARAAKEGRAAREAIGTLEGALKIVGTLPPGDQRARVERRLLLELGEARIAVHGYAAPAVKSSYERAYALSALDPVAGAERLIAQTGLVHHHMLRSEFALAERWAQDIAPQETAASPAGMRADWVLAEVLLARGELAKADAALERVASCPQGKEPLSGGMVSLIRGIHAACLAMRGRIREAHDELNAMLQYVDAHPGDVFAVASAHALAADFHAITGAREAARAHAVRATVLGDTHGLPLYPPPSVRYAWAVGSVDLLRDEIEKCAELHVRIRSPQHGALLGETLLEQGDPAGALAVIREALEAAGETGESYYTPELHRLTGICLLRGAGATPSSTRRDIERTARDAFRLAIKTAREQGAELFHRRAVASAGPRGMISRARTGRNDAVLPPAVSGGAS